MIAAASRNVEAEKKEGAAERAAAVAHLQQIIVGLHEYHNDHKSFPAAASQDKDGKKLLSWRVHILPYLGERDLHSEFHFDEPWDSEHNRSLIAKMPAAFKNPRVGKVKDGFTTFQLPVAAGTMAEEGTEIQVPDVKDGTVNTIFVVEVAAESAVEWTRPSDLKWDKKKPADKLFFDATAESVALFASGDVLLLPKTIDGDNLRLYFLRADGGIPNGAIDIPK
jgi:hypothetical protein